MIVRKLRLERAWSQEQLAELSGLSVRTIQRIERGQNPGLESLKALAAIFEVDVADLTPQVAVEEAMPERPTLTSDEKEALEYVRDVKGFYSHLLSYVVVIGALSIYNLVYSPDYFWAGWAAFGWGIGVLSHGLAVFEIFSLFGPEWEQRQVQKYLDRNRR